MVYFNMFPSFDLEQNSFLSMTENFIKYLKTEISHIINISFFLDSFNVDHCVLQENWTNVANSSPAQF